MESNQLEKKSEALLQLLSGNKSEGFFLQNAGKPINDQLEAAIASLLDTLDPKELALIHQVFGFGEEPLPIDLLSRDMEIETDLLEAQLSHALTKLRNQSSEMADAAG